MKYFHLPMHSRSVFSRIGVVPARQIEGLRRLLRDCFGHFLDLGAGRSWETLSETLRGFQARRAWETPRVDKGPSRTKKTTESESRYGEKFGMDVAKRNRGGSEMPVLLGEKDRKTVQIVKNDGASKILRIRAPSYF